MAGPLKALPSLPSLPSPRSTRDTRDETHKIHHPPQTKREAPGGFQGGPQKGVRQFEYLIYGQLANVAGNMMKWTTSHCCGCKHPFPPTNVEVQRLALDDLCLGHGSYAILCWEGNAGTNTFGFITSLQHMSVDILEIGGGSPCNICTAYSSAATAPISGWPSLYKNQGFKFPDHQGDLKKKTKQRGTPARFGGAQAPGESLCAKIPKLAAIRLSQWGLACASIPMRPDGTKS